MLVFFHEWGHFIAAKLCGIRVEEFAFGFGPTLVQRCSSGATPSTRSTLVPLGGFVKLAGMEPGEEDVEDGFQAQPAWKRAIVIFAGPLFSFILGVAVLLFVGVYWGFQDSRRRCRAWERSNPKSEAAHNRPARGRPRAGDQWRQDHQRHPDDEPDPRKAQAATSRS